MTLMNDILDLAQMPGDQIPQGAREKGMLSLLDWMVCGWAGRDEPLAHKLRDLALREAGAGS